MKRYSKLQTCSHVILYSFSANSPSKQQGSRHIVIGAMGSVDRVITLGGGRKPETGIIYNIYVPPPCHGHGHNPPSPLQRAGPAGWGSSAPEAVRSAYLFFKKRWTTGNLGTITPTLILGVNLSQPASSIVTYSYVFIEYASIYRLKRYPVKLLIFSSICCQW